MSLAFPIYFDKFQELFLLLYCSRSSDSIVKIKYFSKKITNGQIKILAKNMQILKPHQRE